MNLKHDASDRENLGLHFIHIHLDLDLILARSQTKGDFFAIFGQSKFQKNNTTTVSGLTFSVDPSDFDP